MLAIAAALLPLIAYSLIFLTLLNNGDWRRTVLVAAIVWGLCLILITELLSLPHLLTRQGLAVSWLFIIGVCLFQLRGTRRSKSPKRLEVHLRRFRFR